MAEQLSREEPGIKDAAQSVGKRIKELRTKFYLTQRELASRLAVSSGYLSDIENGKNNANVDVLVGLSLTFPELNSKWLLTGKGSMILGDCSDSSNNIYATDLDVEALRIAILGFYEKIRKFNSAEGLFLTGRMHFYIAKIYKNYMVCYFQYLKKGKKEDDIRETLEKTVDILIGTDESAKQI